jgi:copper chaperone
MKAKITIEGMSCGHCVKHVSNALSELENVENIQVSLENKTALFESKSEIADEKIKFAIEDAGYEVVKIERS